MSGATGAGDGRLASTPPGGTQDGGGAPGCMSGTTDPECPAIFNQLQINFGAGADGLPINGGAAQKIFRAAAK